MLCPDGRHYFDIDVIRAAVTRLMIDGELAHPVGASLASKAAVSGSTVSKVLNGRRIGLRMLLAVLAALGLTYADVISQTMGRVEESSDADAGQAGVSVAAR